MASAPRDGGSPWHPSVSSTKLNSSSASSPGKARKPVKAPRSTVSTSSGASSSASASSGSQKTAGALYIPSFTSTYHSQMHAAGYPAVPVIQEADSGHRSRPRGEVDDDNDDDDEEDDEDDEDLSLSDTEAVVGVGSRDSLDERRSIASSSDDISVLSTSVSSSTTSSRVPAHSVPRRPVPLISTATFTSLSSANGARQSSSHSAVSSSSSRHAGLSKMRRGSTSSRKSLADNSSAVSLILEDSASTSSKAPSRASRLLKKASTTSLTSLGSKAKSSTVDLTQSSASLNRRGHTNPLGLSKSRFSFLQRHPSGGSTAEPAPILTGGARQQLAHHLYKVLPSTSDSQHNGSNNGGGSSNSSSNSSSTSLSSTPTNSSANLSQLAVFAPSKPSETKSARKPMDGKLSLDVRRLSISSQQGSPIAPFPSASSVSSAVDKHKHHLKLRSRKEGHSGMILSSSSSNSKLTSDAGSIYSFNPASPANAPYVPSGLQKSISTIDVKTLSYKDINKISGDQALEDVWPFLCAKVMPLFAGDGLRVPVEDLNKLVLLHTKRRIAERDPSMLITDVKDLFKLGVSVFDDTSTVLSYSDVEIVDHVVDIWRFYYFAVLPYIEAVFLPLQLEFDGVGVIMTKEGAQKFWAKQKSQPVKMNNVKKMSLASFRDWIILPLYIRLRGAIAEPTTEITKDSLTVLLKCMRLLATVQSGDSKHEKINELTKITKECWIKAIEAEADF